MQPRQIIMQGSRSAVEIQSLLRNTYLLLSLTLLFSAAMSFYGMLHPASGGGMLITFIMGFVLLFATTALRNSVWGLLGVFAFTGCMGYSMGPC